MKSITLQDLVTATGGKLISAVQDGSICITGAESDNRKIQEGDVFFAFPGERSDGHRFVQAALEAGAAGAVISKVPACSVPGKFYLLVEDTVAALGDLARWYRAQFEIPVVGITGSVGKTTTKDMTAAVLARHFRTAATEGNFNNHIGLPRTVLTIEEETQAAVIEMGMNHAGEISYLTRIARPTAAVITNIGEAHIGNLGSKEGIFRAKCEIFEGLAEDGFAVLNGDDEYLVRLKDPGIVRARGIAGQKLIFVGESASCDWRAADIDDTGSESVRFTAVTPIGTFPVSVPAPGRHMIYSALTAAAVGAQLGMPAEEIQAGIADYVPTKLRMEILRPTPTVVIYNDTYNANPQSMKAGLLTLSRTAGLPAGDPVTAGGGPGTAAAGGRAEEAAAPGSDREKAAAPMHSRRIAVVGDMFELGEREEPLHREVGAYAAGLGLDTLVTVGRAAEYLADEARRCGMRDVRSCPDKETAKPVLKELAGPDTVWLFKASRGMALEELAAYTAELLSR